MEDKGGGNWVRKTTEQRTVGGITYQIQSYRPRIEGLFARIERWTEKTSGRIRWRVITRDNVTTLFGWTPRPVNSDPSTISLVFTPLDEPVI